MNVGTQPSREMVRAPVIVPRPPLASESARQAPVELREIMGFPPGSAVFEVAAQREFGTRERDINPGNVLRLDQHGFQALDADAEARFPQDGPEKYMDLLRMQNVHHRK